MYQRATDGSYTGRTLNYREKYYFDLESSQLVQSYDDPGNVVKFSTLLSTLNLYINPTIIMPLGEFIFTKIVLIPSRMKVFIIAG